MNAPLKFPFYARASLSLIGLYFFVLMLSTAQDILLPLIYATMVAILLNPAVNFLVNKKINRAVSIALVLLITFLMAGGLIALLASQASLFHQAWPQIVVRLQALLGQSLNWASRYFSISGKKVNAWVGDTINELMKNRNVIIGGTLTTMSGILSATVLTPVYIFMILFYQPHLLSFTHRVFGADNDEKTSEILTETKGIIKSYLVGLFVEFVIIAILNSAGLLALRIKYAIMLGIIGALLNVIPIIGGVVCVALFVLVALLTKSPVYILYVLGLYALIQFIDDHYIFPKIVGAKVKLNLLVSIIAVIAGEALWGIPGMFLAIPLTAIIKVIFDRVDSLKPWGILLGDTPHVERENRFVLLISKFFKKIHQTKT